MNKTVLITGASSGIGRAAAKRFARANWNVIATMRSPQAENELNGIDGILVTRLDVEEPDSIDTTIKTGLARFGRIDVLVNNAGFGQYGLFEATPREKVRRQFDVNVFGLMDVTRTLLPHFRANKSGLVINVSSGAGIFTLPMISLYCASKFAVEGFSEALAYELQSQNIGVKLVIPHGGVNDTSFGERSAADRAENAVLPDYDEFVEHTNQAFARMTAARTIDSADVAEVIFEAASDGSDRLRYLVGNDTRGFIKARRTMSDENYVAFLRSHFRAAQ